MKKETASIVGASEVLAGKPAVDDPQPEKKMTAQSKTVDLNQLNRTTAKSELVTEINGPKGLEPTRYGDWESKGRCHDF